MSRAVVEDWSDSEQVIARQAFERAYSRAIEQLVLTVRARSAELSTADTIWALHDFLSVERHTIEGRFDFRFEGLLFVFASLVKEQLLQLEELAGLEADKLAKITAMVRF